MEASIQREGGFRSKYPDIETSGYRVRFHRALTRVPLLFGGQLPLVLANMALGLVMAGFVLYRIVARGGFVQPTSVWVVSTVGLLVPAFIHAKVLPLLASGDPLRLDVWRNHRRVRGFYPARARLDAPDPPRPRPRWRL